MSTQAPTAAPTRFHHALRRARAASSLSLREIARRADISPAYLSRLLANERGVPENDVIERLETALELQPRGQLFDGAGRHDKVLSKVIDKDEKRVLMRALAPLSDEDFAKVVKLAQDLAGKAKPRKP